jgi:hypothetical protein
MNRRFLPFFCVLAVIAFACIMPSCATTDTTPGPGGSGSAPDADAAAPPPAAPVISAKNESPLGKEYYTAANIWYKHPWKIWSLNRHQGAMLSVGTRVTIKDISRSAIHFVDQKGTKYRLLLARKYSAPGFTIKDLFEQYFAVSDPMAKDGAFTRLNEQEKNAVRTGRIAPGMSKEAVLMAYGYPPSHMTPALESDVWKYWVHRFRAQLVYFSNGRVTEIKEVL